jgi:hypothetical protein
MRALASWIMSSIQSPALSQFRFLKPPGLAEALPLGTACSFPSFQYLKRIALLLPGHADSSVTAGTLVLSVKRWMIAP